MWRTIEYGSKPLPQELQPIDPINATALEIEVIADSATGISDHQRISAGPPLVTIYQHRLENPYLRS
jgi:hypothetical protein